MTSLGGLIENLLENGKNKNYNPRCMCSKLAIKTQR